MLTSPAKIALSFAAAFVGWTAGVSWFVAWSALGPGFGYVTDFESIAAWSGLFTLSAWAIALAPVALFVSEERAVYRFPWSVPFGGVCGVVLCGAFLAPSLVGISMLVDRPSFLAHAALVGAVSWCTYALAARHARSSRSVVIAGFAFPVLALGTFQFVLWPAFERCAPAAAYRFGTDSARDRLFERALRELRLGDSIETLRAKLPGEFAFDTTRTTGNHGPHFRYTLEFVNGRVTKIELVEKP